MPYGLLLKKEIMLSQSIEDYLKTIYKLQHGSDASTQVTTSLLAERMGVTAASATNMIKKLAEMNLLEYAPYKGVALRGWGKSRWRRSAIIAKSNFIFPRHF